MSKFNKKEKKEIKEYRDLFPRSLEVRISITKEGDLIAEVLNYPGCYTQASYLGELIYMVNDAVYTVLEIPEKYHSEMPSYTPPASLARALNVLPKKDEDIESPVKFSLEGV